MADAAETLAFIRDAERTRTQLAAASKMLAALKAVVATKHAMLAFIISGKPANESEWDTRHKELSGRQNAAHERAIAAIAAAEAAGIKAEG